MQHFDFEEGEVLLLDKPLHWTSFDVVKKIRNALRIKKIGHAGTLDPLASGLLVLCTGRKTKMINQIQDAEKEYTGSFTLGATTPSFDLETEVNARFGISHLTEAELLAAAARMTGEQLQTPPLYSAIMVNGVRAYELARKGQHETELKSRPILIREFEITRVELPEVYFRIVCSKGTYIRSIARDFGLELGAGAYLSSLVRTRIGELLLQDALSVEQAVDIAKAYRESRASNP